MPIDHVIAIYARENGQGMALPDAGERAGRRRAGGRAPTALRPPAGARRSRAWRAAGQLAEATARRRRRRTPMPPPPEPPPKRPSLKRVK